MPGFHYQHKFQQNSDTRSCIGDAGTVFNRHYRQFFKKRFRIYRQILRHITAAESHTEHYGNKCILISLFVGEINAINSGHLLFFDV